MAKKINPTAWAEAMDEDEGDEGAGGPRLGDLVGTVGMGVMDEGPPFDPPYNVELSRAKEVKPGERVWTDQQNAIFEWAENGTGNLVVVARAGTGKTTTAVEMVSRSREASHNLKVLMCAFNKDIAVELSNRLKYGEARTLHSVCLEYCRANWRYLEIDDGRDRDIATWVCIDRMFGEEVEPDIIKTVIDVAAFAKNTLPRATHEQLVELAQDMLGGDAEDLDWDAWGVAEAVHRVMWRAKQPDKSFGCDVNKISFDDMVWLAVVNGWVYPKWHLVVVDEAQDMNVCQIEAAIKACFRDGRLAVIGDDRQGIYAFRGGDSASLGRLEVELKAKKLTLTVTYRCPQSHVALAKVLVPDFEAWHGNPIGEVVRMDWEKMVEVVEPGDFVISRLNLPNAIIAMRLLRKGVRCYIAGKDLGASLVSLVSKITGKAKKAPTMAEWLQRLEKWEKGQLEKMGALGGDEDKQAQRKMELDDRVGVLRALAMGLNSVEELKTRVMHLFKKPEKGERDYVLCSTIHKIKGQEADRAWVLMDTLYKRGVDLEEQNCHYVAITRGKKLLGLVTGEPGKRGEVEVA